MVWHICPNICGRDVKGHSPCIQYFGLVVADTTLGRVDCDVMMLTFGAMMVLWIDE